MKETLGEIAYNAYCDSVNWQSIRGEPLPKFREQSVQLKLAWESAAYAARFRRDGTFRSHEPKSV